MSTKLRTKENDVMLQCLAANAAGKFLYNKGAPTTIDVMLGGESGQVPFILIWPMVHDSMAWNLEDTVTVYDNPDDIPMFLEQNPEAKKYGIDKIISINITQNMITDGEKDTFDMIAYFLSVGIFKVYLDIMMGTDPEWINDLVYPIYMLDIYQIMFTEMQVHEMELINWLTRYGVSQEIITEEQEKGFSIIKNKWAFKSKNPMRSKGYEGITGAIFTSPIHIIIAKYLYRMNGERIFDGDTISKIIRKFWNTYGTKSSENFNIDKISTSGKIGTNLSGLLLSAIILSEVIHDIQ